ncbi:MULTISPECIES: hypothetical protein [Sphingobacterium]|nr:MULTISPECIES: hypothetical protein [Sphingobacterium]QIH32844.1 hypothetical protein G6053_08025 [Sphingobacterium sp. DR205]
MSGSWQGIIESRWEIVVVPGRSEIDTAVDIRLSRIGGRGRIGLAE